jgi:hypothetical protein
MLLPAALSCTRACARWPAGLLTHVDLCRPAGEAAALQQEGSQLLLQALAAAASYKVDAWEVRMKFTEALLLAAQELTAEVRAWGAGGRLLGGAAEALLLGAAAAGGLLLSWACWPCTCCCWRVVPGLCQEPGLVHLGIGVVAPPACPWPMSASPAAMPSAHARHLPSTAHVAYAISYIHTCVISTAVANWPPGGH